MWGTEEQSSRASKLSHDYPPNPRVEVHDVCYRHQLVRELDDLVLVPVMMSLTYDEVVVLVYEAIFFVVWLCIIWCELVLARETNKRTRGLRGTVLRPLSAMRAVVFHSRIRKKSSVIPRLLLLFPPH